MNSTKNRKRTRTPSMTMKFCKKSSRQQTKYDEYASGLITEIDLNSFRSRINLSESHTQLLVFWVLTIGRKSFRLRGDSFSVKFFMITAFRILLPYVCIDISIFPVFIEERCFFSAFTCSEPSLLSLLIRRDSCVLNKCN